MLAPPRLRSLARLVGRREVLLLAAVALLGVGDTVNFGSLSTLAIDLVLLGLMAAVLASRAPDAPAGRGFWALVAALCAVEGYTYVTHFGAAGAGFTVLALALTTALMVVSPRRIRPVAALCALGSLAAFVYAVLPWRWGFVDIDVFQSLQNAGAALLHGQNPYATTFGTPDMVAPQLFVLRTVHFQYLPGAALVAAAASLLGDVRIGGMLAMVVVVACTVHMARRIALGGRRGIELFALCLALPMTTAMLFYAWVDVYSIAGFAAWLALRERHPRWAVVCLAFSLSVKPTILIALVPWVLWSRAARRELLFAAAAALALLIPFVIATGPAALYQDVIGVQAKLGFRYDGLTLSAWTYALTGHLPPIWLSPAIGALFAWFALRRRPQTPVDLLIAGAVLSVAGFLLAKWAFLNYYFIPVWLLMLALAARDARFADGEVALPRPFETALMWWQAWLSRPSRRARRSRAGAATQEGRSRPASA